mgnify:FL=1
MKKTYSAAPRVLRSWLRATGISFRPEGKDVSVDGVRITVVKPGEKADGISVLDSEIGSSNREIAIKAFHTITEKLGKGKPEPTYRGEPEKIYGNDIALSAMRHREFRHAPNLTKEQLKPYEKTIDRCCRRFASMNRSLLQKHMYDFDDLKTYALVWTHIFAHKCEPVELKVNDGKDLSRLLSRHLNQKFIKLFSILNNKTDSTCPDTETAHVCLTGEVLDQFSEATEETEEEVLQPKMTHEQIKENLAQRLGALEHSKMIAALQENSVNPNRDRATKLLAKRMLEKHRSECATCLSE